MKLLNKEDFEFYFNPDNSIRQKLSLIINLFDNEIIIKNKIYYIFENKTSSYIKYDGEQCGKDFLRCYINDFLDDSRLKLNSETKELFKLKYKKQYFKLLNCTDLTDKTIGLYIVKIKLKSKNIIFDDDNHGIHFKNGRFNLKSGKLEPRLKKMYITNILNLDYNDPTKKEIKFANNELKKCFDDNESFKYMKNYIGSCFSGSFINNQSFMLHYGHGSSGKSTIFSILSKILGDYFVYLPIKTFENNYGKIDKILADIKPYNRIFVVEELPIKNQNTSLIKSFSDGCISTTKLYTDGTYKMKLNGVLNFISNHLISFHNDSGIERRTIAYEYKNYFISENEGKGSENYGKKVNNKTIFKKNCNFQNELTDGQKIAFFKIFARETKKYYKKIVLKIPDSFVISKNEIIDANDVWKDFIESYLIKTDDKADIISKSNMMEKVNSSFNFKNKKDINHNIILRELKIRGIQYNKNIMRNKLRGVYTHVKFDNFEDDLEFIDDNQPDLKDILKSVGDVVIDDKKDKEEKKILRKNCKKRNLVNIKKCKNKNKTKIKQHNFF